MILYNLYKMKSYSYFRSSFHIVDRDRGPTQTMILLDFIHKNKKVLGTSTMGILPVAKVKHREYKK